MNVAPKIFRKPTFLDGTDKGLLVNGQWRPARSGKLLESINPSDGKVIGRFAEGGEDVDFFRRAIAIGRRFIWCGEAHVNETIPPERLRLSFHVRRALLRGRASRHHPANSGVGVLKSLVACVVYTACLPFLIVLGRHVFVKYLIKDLDHLGKLLALCHIDLIGPGYIVK